MTPPNEHASEGGRDDRGVPYHAESTLSIQCSSAHSSTGLRSAILERDAWTSWRGLGPAWTSRTTIGPQVTDSIPYPSPSTIVWSGTSRNWGAGGPTRGRPLLYRRVLTDTAPESMPPEGSAECAKRRAGMRMRYSQVEAGDGEGLAESTANRDAVSERPSLSARGGKPRRWRQGR